MTIHKNFDLSDILWYKIGGTAKYFLEVSSREDFSEAFEFLQKNNVSKFMVIGLGANLIFAEDFYDGAIIHLVEPNRDSTPIHKIDEDQVKAFGGVLLDSVIQFSFENQLSGLEWAGGLPSTVGAAVRGNVGAFGGEIKDSLVSGEVFDFDSGEFRTLENSDFHFGYRESILKHERNLILVSALFGLKKVSSEEIEDARATYAKNRDYRKQNHPLEYPNCGSVFKNIKKPEEVAQILSVIPEIKEKVETAWHGKVSMGYLIHYLGFTGYKVGNAQVSEKHNNFIVNLGDAKAIDVLTIIKAIQNKCQEVFGFTPEVEVEIVK